MKILDSNLWVTGTLKTNQTAVDLLADIEAGTITSAMDEYILAETLAAFDRVLTGSAHDRTVTTFLVRLHDMEGLIDFPGWQAQRSAQQTTVLEYHRERTAVTMFAQIFDIQAKDAPIIIYSYEYRDYQPTILTNDHSFSKFDPAEYNLANLSMQHIE